jgi:hypothetical protein
MRLIIHTLVFFVGSWIVFLPYSWANQSLDRNEADKVHLINCQPMVAQVIKCQHDRARSLFQPATNTPFKLHSVTVETYQASCGEDTCDYLMLALATDGGAIQIKDFQGDDDRARLQASRFKTLFNQPTSQANVQLRYENSWYTNFLKLLLLIPTVGLWFAVMIFFSILFDRWCN